LSDDPGSGHYTELLNRLLDGLRGDVVSLREQNGDIERVARDAFSKINELERRLIVLEQSQPHSHKEDGGWRLTPAWFTAIVSAVALLATGLFHAGKAFAALLVETLKVRP